MAKALIDTKGDAATRPWKRYPGWPARDESKFNTLAHVASPPAPKEPRAVPALTGDPAKGEKLVADRNRGGSCLACHVMGPAGGADLPGNVGARSVGRSAMLGLSDEQLFNFVYDARVYNPETVMPPWGGHGMFNDQEIMDMVAFLKTLKSPAAFKTALDDPSKRPPPVEKRENLDPIENPGMWAIDKAKELWKTRGPAGFACGTCHGNPEVSFKTWAVDHAEMGAAARQGAGRRGVRHPPRQGDHRRQLADGDRREPRHVGLPAQSRQRRADHGRHQQRAAPRRRSSAARSSPAASSASSISPAPIATANRANHWIRGQWLGEPKGQYDHFPTWRTSLQTVWDIRQRFQWCQVNIRADELPPDAKEYGDLELYLASLNNGLKLSVPGIRH